MLRRAINAAKPLIASQGSLLSTFPGCLFLPLSCLPINSHDRIKKHNATVCERMLVRIEKSHPHYSTTRSDAPACTASLLTVPMCTYFIPSCILENTPISADSSISPLSLCSKWFGVPLSFTCTGWMFSLFGMIAHIQFWLKLVIGLSSIIGEWHKEKKKSVMKRFPRNQPSPCCICFKTEVCLPAR